MKRNSIKILLMVLSVFTLCAFSYNYEKAQKRILSAWIPYWDIKGSTINLQNYFLNKIDEVNPFFFALDKDANIVNASNNPEDYNRLAEILRQLNIKIIPVITNDIIYSQSNKKIKDPDIIKRILNNDDLRQKHIQQILQIIKDTGADGIDIDYENLYTQDKAIFSQFIQELSQSLHDNNKILIVTVTQKTENHDRDGAGAVDWQEISQYADKIMIMCYNYSYKTGKPGPLCPTSWLNDIIKFAKTQIPQEKIGIALGFYGYDWSKKETITLNRRQAKNLIDTYQVKLNWDKKSQSPYFSYSKDGAIHNVWFEDEKSIYQKLNIIKKHKIKNIGIWHLGMLDSAFLDSFQ
jgi:spore germination protein